ncbi:MAG: tyrosine-type recombinase/integrase [Peptostreptococcaceae bacterium]|nr:tyrosine-type recombinase/integrase [Peptostreptococcaceae bacterium]
MSFKDEMLTDYRQMLELKTSLGFAESTYSFYIEPFIKHCAEVFPDATYVTKDMVDEWLLARPFNTNATRSHAISNIRGFTRYLNTIGKNAYIPSEEYSLKVEHFQPYIFTDEELSVLFEAIDSIPPSFEAPQKEFVVPVLFRMMYCCGMRPAEPLHLRTEDVDLANGDIYIRQSKLSKDRHIIMSDDLKDLCIKYDYLMGARNWFFQKWDGSSFPTYWMTNQFRICWRNSGLEKHGNPRPYDLRHCFATRTLMRWVDEGRDIMALLPYLSTYMGHKSLKHTLYYVHILPQRLRSTVGIDWQKLDTVYTGEDSYEEN